MVADPLDRAATAERLTAIAAAGGLSDQALARALELASESPPPAQWRAFLSRSLLFLGAALMLAGVIFFFAFNWADLGRFAKLALLELAVAGAAAGAWQFGRNAAGEAALTAAAVLVGPLLAVYGQAYQTGADAWELFAFWAALILPWVALARMPALWLVEIALWNVTAVLLWQQRLSSRFEDELDPVWAVLALIDGGAWLLGESLQRGALRWPRPRWPLRLLAVAAFAFASPRAFGLALGIGSHLGEQSLGLLLLAALAGAAYFLSRRPERRDLFLLAVAGAAVLAFIGCVAGRFLFSAMDDVGAVLVMALVVLGEVGALVAWLRKMGSAEVDEA